MKLLTKQNNEYQLNPKLSEAKRSEITITNKCTDCDNAYTYIPIGEGNIYQACKLDTKRVNCYGCDDDLDNKETTSNIDDKTEGEEPKGYPDLDYDPNDLNYEDKDRFLDKHQQGY